MSVIPGRKDYNPDELMNLVRVNNWQYDPREPARHIFAIMADANLSTKQKEEAVIDILRDTKHDGIIALQKVLERFEKWTELDRQETIAQKEKFKKAEMEGS